MASISRLVPVPLLSPSARGPGKGPPQPPPPPPPATVLAARGIKKRTTHACDRCRLMRTKCSGGTRCTRCTKDDAVCLYGDHKRERNKKDLADSFSRIKELEDENIALVAVLQQVASTSDLEASGHGDITELLAKYADREPAESSVGSRSQSRSVKSPLLNTRVKSGEGGEGQVSSAIGSPGRQGELRRVIDPDHGTGATGFVGKMSEMSWMQRCREYLAKEPATSAMDIDQPQLDQHAAAAEILTYFMDDTNLLAIDEDHVNPLQWPPFESAVILAEACFHATEGIFEFLSHEEFIDTMYNFYQTRQRPSWNQRRWTALANLVWAIGSKWLSLAKLDGPEFPEHHLVYYARARALGLDHRISFDHPDVDTVQGMGLMAFYLLTNGSISRAWNVIGNAVRHAMTLGLHLRISDPSINAQDQHRRARTWSSLYAFQILVAEITGRPHFARTAHVTIMTDVLDGSIHNAIHAAGTDASYSPGKSARQAWLDFLSATTNMESNTSQDVSNAVEPSNQNLIVPRELFVYQIRLCQLSEEIADGLYTGRQEVPWSETQFRIGELQESLDAWVVTLPEELKPDRPSRESGSSRANIQLAMYSASVSMILHRPCLCDIRIDNESEKSKGFNQMGARTCVRAAIAMLEMIPDDFVPHKVYQMLPWWTLLHYLCQAASVLLLELCLDAQHFQGESEPLMTAMWKAMTCLSYMTEGSMSAYRAWRIFHSLLEKVSVRYVETNLSKILSQIAAAPEEWGEVEESNVRAALDYQWIDD